MSRKQIFYVVKIRNTFFSSLNIVVYASIYFAAVHIHLFFLRENITPTFSNKLVYIHSVSLGNVYKLTENIWYLGGLKKLVVEG